MTISTLWLAMIRCYATVWHLYRCAGARDAGKRLVLDWLHVLGNSPFLAELAELATLFKKLVAAANCDDSR